MRYFWSILWFAILANITAYVAGSMTSKTPDFLLATIVGGICGLLVGLLGRIANIEPDSAHH
ncbi:MAG: hypothetical protein K0R71_922 [Bacillales bacterium]|jgi:uncharacterized membrane protein YdjX (TVP38/TMEM64 family)|nr:hypothetical protein [Bacillales bacterium]